MQFGEVIVGNEPALRVSGLAGFSGRATRHFHIDKDKPGDPTGDSGSHPGLCPGVCRRKGWRSLGGQALQEGLGLATEEPTQAGQTQHTPSARAGALEPGGASCRQPCQPCHWAQGAHGRLARTRRADLPTRQPAPQREDQRRGPGAADRACIPGLVQACGEQGCNPGGRPRSTGAIAASQMAVDVCPPPGLRPGSVAVCCSFYGKARLT